MDALNPLPTGLTSIRYPLYSTTVILRRSGGELVQQSPEGTFSVNSGHSDIALAPLGHHTSMATAIPATITNSSAPKA